MTGGVEGGVAAHFAPLQELPFWRAVNTRLRVTKWRMMKLIDAGHVLASDDRATVFLGADQTIEAMRARVLEELGREPPATPAAFDRLAADMSLLWITADDLPDAVMLACIADARRSGRLVTSRNISAYVGNERRVAPILRRLEREGHDLGRLLDSQYRSAGVNNDLAALERVLGRRYRIPPGTPLDPKLGHSGDAPAPKATEKVYDHMEPGPLRSVAAILLLLEAARTWKPHNADWLMDGIMPLDAVLKGVANDPAAVRAALDRYRASVPPGHKRERQRLSRIYMYKTVHDRFETWLDGLKPSERRRFEPLSLAMPTGAVRFFKAIAARLAVLEKKGQDRIDGRVQHLVDRPHHASIVASERVAEVLGIRDRARLEIVSAMAKGLGPDDFPIRFLHPYVAIRVVGEQVYRFPQKLVLELDRWTYLDRRLARDLPETDYKARRRQPYDASREPDTNGFENEWLVSYVDCVPETPGGAVSPPHWVEYHRVRLFDCARLDAAARAVRDAVMLRDGFPAAILQMPAGLMAFEGKNKREIARRAADLYGVVPLPVEETLHGFAYAGLLFQSLLDDGGRPGEGMQIAEDEDRWDFVTQGGKEYRAYKGLAKNKEVGQEELFGIGEESEEALGLAIRVTAERWFFTPAQKAAHGIDDPRYHLPVTPPNRDLAMRRIGSARNVLNHRRRQLASGSGTKLVTVLMGGYLVVEGHDMRRAFGGGVRKLGANRDERRRLLKHDSPESQARYGEATPSEQLSMQLKWLGHLARETRPEARSMAHVEERRRDVIAVTGGLPPVLGGGCLRRGPCDIRLACLGCADHAPEPERRDDVVYMLGRAEALEAYARGAGNVEDARRAAADAERCRAKLTEIDEVARLRAEEAAAATGAEGAEGSGASTVGDGGEDGEMDDGRAGGSDGGAA